MDVSRRDALTAALTTCLAGADDALLQDALARLEWVEIKGGQTLVAAGDAPDAMYLVVTGRLRLAAADASRAQADFTRGDTVGETALLLGEPHRAAVVAVRDSVVGRLGAADFHALWRHPAFSMRVSRSTVAKLMARGERKHERERRTLCLVPITDGIDPASFSEALAQALARWGSVTVQGRHSVNDRFGATAANARPAEALYHSVATWLDEIERAHDFVLLVADDGETEWTRRCIRHSDEVLFIARTDSPLRIHPVEERLCMAPRAITAARQSLVLLHSQWRRHPTGTAAWVDRRPIDAHYHVRGELPSDFARLGRILSGNAVGLVLSGGGAKGFAHLGAFKALEEAGIDVDMVGGTSIGAVMAGYVSFGRTAAELIEFARGAFETNPTGDFNLLPLISLMKGRRLKKVIRNAVVAVTGFEADALDSWLTFFCVASSYSGAREVVLTRGPIDRAIRASVSIPVALPAVPWDGELLVDGGIFNNFPANVMARMGASRLIGVDLSRREAQSFDFEEMPGSWQVLMDRKRHAGVPSLGATLVETTLLYNESRREESRRAVDIYINPDLSRIGLLDWKSFDATVEIGYRETLDVLARMDAAQLAPYLRQAPAAQAGEIAPIRVRPGPVAAPSVARAAPLPAQDASASALD
jgi:NTE family protein